jgi:hypothetical protein
MMHNAKTTSADTPDIAKKVANPPRRIESQGTGLHAGTTAGYAREIGLKGAGLGTYFETAERMMHGEVGFHGTNEHIRKSTLASEAIGLFLTLLKMAGLPEDYSHKSVAYIFNEMIGNQHETDASNSVEAKSDTPPPPPPPSA